MNKKESFKEFVSQHPELLSYVKKKENTWQDFYEIYDIYGDNQDAWEKFFKGDDNSSLKELTGIFKNINMDSVQKHITNAQKAINLIQELTTKNAADNITKTPRPITKFFGD